MFLCRGGLVVWLRMNQLVRTSKDAHRELDRTFQIC